VAAVGGSADQAFAVSPHPDGTVTVSIADLSGVTGANAKLLDLGDRVVIVPVRAGCPSMASLPNPAVTPGQISGSVTGSKQNGTITVDAHGIPEGDLMVLAVQQTGNGIRMAGTLTSPPAPACVSLPTSVGAWPGSRHGGGQGYGGNTAHVGSSGARSTSGPATFRSGPTGPTVTAGPAKGPVPAAG
jgi:hypothetical protein